ncbi:MAG TPA: hypothetical protein PK605_01620 [Ignavibacteria bacterium]|nr:hypothetical protein [Bacteroidota bacterium]HRE11809.1 hypothetical protein [Ignavibacteria bacterium]HRF67381.1 hypothetical protein [Ignavibacteria bacterium]HRJ03079.1 hypothetical protein [Ignavibacteria bacterium]
MLLTGNIFSELNKAFTTALKKSEIHRLAIHEEFAAFYNNDYETICSYLREATLNNPFSEETLKDLRFRHINIIKKIINRITSGIFTKDPVIKHVEAEKSQQDLLTELLTECRFVQKIKEAFRKAVYFNTVEANVIWDHEMQRIRIDIVTPNNYTVETGGDYLEKSVIAVRKADKAGEIYWSVWSETGHYLVKGDAIIPPENNSEMVNPYYNPASNSSSLPFAALRIEEGEDYFGEPNWNIFLHQKNLDIRLTDLNETELKTLHQIYLGINTNFTAGESFKAGDFKQINNVKDDDKEPKIESIISNADYGAVRDNIDWHNKLVLSSEAIGGNSASTEVTAESGAAKKIDELELFERREEYKTTLYHFMAELLRVITMVWNCYNPKQALPADGRFDVRFVEADLFESIDDKRKRYDMALEYGYKDNIDIAAGELEVSEDEAKEIIRVRKERSNGESEV